MQKTVYDMRGKVTNVNRLAAFDTMGYVHMIFYRIAIFVAVAYGIILLLWYVIPGLDFVVKFTTALMWILFTPQFFETRKGIVMVVSKGLALGHLNQEYKMSVKAKYHSHRGILAIGPYAATLVWIFMFFVMLTWWFL